MRQEFDLTSQIIQTTPENISSDESIPPKPLSWEYIQIGFFASMILLGVPLNVASLVKSLRTRSSATAMHVLKIHLALTDLMILFFFALSKLVWWSTYEWLAGDFMCKLVAFFCTLAFYSNSNLIALIATVRYMAVKCLTNNGPFYPKKFGLYFYIAYGLAICMSLPQVFVWCIAYPYPNFPNWGQCVTRWGAIRWMDDKAADNFTEEEIYELVHLLFIFWLPLTIVCVTSLGVWVQLKRTVREFDRNFGELQHCAFPLNQFPDGMIDVEQTSLNNANSVQEVPALLVVRKTTSERSFSFSVNRLLTTKKRMMKKTAYILLAYILCWSSYNVVALLEFLGVDLENHHWRMLYSLIVLNAVVNPFVYGM